MTMFSLVDTYVQIGGLILFGLMVLSIIVLYAYGIYWSVKDEITWQKYLKEHNDLK